MDRELQNEYVWKRMKNTQKKDGLCKGKSQIFGLWVPSFFGILFTFVHSPKTTISLSILIFLTLAVQYALLYFAFFIFEIYADKLFVTFPFRFKNSTKEIPFDQIEKVLYEDKYSAAVYGPVSIVQLKIKNKGKKDNIKLHLHHWKRKDLIEVLTIFKDAGLKISVDTKHQKVWDIFMSKK